MEALPPPSLELSPNPTPTLPLLLLPKKQPKSPLSPLVVVEAGAIVVPSEAGAVGGAVETEVVTRRLPTTTITVHQAKISKARIINRLAPTLSLTRRGRSIRISRPVLGGPVPSTGRKDEGLLIVPIL